MSGRNTGRGDNPAGDEKVHPHRRVFRTFDGHHHLHCGEFFDASLVGRRYLCLLRRDHVSRCSDHAAPTRTR